MTCFKAYDIRGRVPEELNSKLALNIGFAYANVLKPRRLVVGRDVRESSQEICDALIEALLHSGVDVIDIGLVGTEIVYYATQALSTKGVDGGIMITASHNPKCYNGMKFVGPNSSPIYIGNGLEKIQNLVEKNVFFHSQQRGSYTSLNCLESYGDFVASLVNPKSLQPLRIVTNSGNGTAGLAIDAIAHHLPLRLNRIQHDPDSSFPNGVPNPLIKLNRQYTSQAVGTFNADFGVAFDGDHDRCFFFDHEGTFIESYYIVGLLAEKFLKEFHGENIVYEPRAVWNILSVIQSLGGVPVISKTGHAFMKEKMRETQAVYGGEISGHHYFRSFGFCDSGMLPWVYLAEILSSSKCSLKEMLKEKKDTYAVSEEVSFPIVGSFSDVLLKLHKFYEKEVVSTSDLDGKTFEFTKWRFNIRPSNTEPLIRLNIETTLGNSYIEYKQEEILKIINYNVSLG